jgi:hypothetical protein
MACDTVRTPSKHTAEEIYNPERMYSISRKGEGVSCVCAWAHACVRVYVCMCVCVFVCVYLAH